MAKAIAAGLLRVDFVDPRAFSEDRHRHVDDRPFGGGPGMVLQAGPLARALGSIPSPGRMICLAASGRPASQTLARELSRERDLTFVCGRYEGLDERLFRLFPLEPVSVGDIVLNGGESAALALLEAAARLVPGFMGKEESGEDESFSRGLLEYPQYTRPPVFAGEAVPEVLLSGNHGEIAAWRRRASLEVTLARRPGLLEEACLTAEDARYLAGLKREDPAASLALCLVPGQTPRPWEKPCHLPVRAEELPGFARLGELFGLAGVWRAGDFSAAESRVPPGGASPPPAFTGLAEAAERLADRAGGRPFLCGVAPWPKKGPALSCARLRRLALERPVLLVLGAGGLPDRATLARLDGTLRPLSLGALADALLYAGLLLGAILAKPF